MRIFLGCTLNRDIWKNRSYNTFGVDTYELFVTTVFLPGPRKENEHHSAFFIHKRTGHVIPTSQQKTWIERVQVVAVLRETGEEISGRRDIRFRGVYLWRGTCLQDHLKDNRSWAWRRYICPSICNSTKTPGLNYKLYTLMPRPLIFKWYLIHPSTL